MQVGLAVAAGGAIGALARYGTVAALKRADVLFPWGTLLVNVAGSFLIGVAWAWCLARPETPDWLRIGLMTGVLGGFTTLSAVSLETLVLLQAHAYAPAIGNMAANMLLGLCACFAGVWLGRMVLPA